MNLHANLIPLYMYLGSPLPRPEHLYDYLIARQGLVKRVESPVASADLLLAPIQADLIGLRLQPSPLQPLQLKVPRIPGRLLQAVLADARANIEQEVMYQVKLDAREGWSVTRPAQERAWARVGYRSDPTGVILRSQTHSSPRSTGVDRLEPYPADETLRCQQARSAARAESAKSACGDPCLARQRLEVNRPTGLESSPPAVRRRPRDLVFLELAPRGGGVGP